MSHWRWDIMTTLWRHYDNVMTTLWRRYDDIMTTLWRHYDDISHVTLTLGHYDDMSHVTLTLDDFIQRHSCHVVMSHWRWIMCMAWLTLDKVVERQCDMTHVVIMPQRQCDMTHVVIMSCHVDTLSSVSVTWLMTWLMSWRAPPPVSTPESRPTYSRTEEIRLKIITNAKISDKFSRDSTYISNTFSQESPNFQTGFYVSKQSPHHLKEFTGNPDNLEIQKIQVRSPPWAGTSHGTQMNESFHTDEWVMAHRWMSRGTQMNESWHTMNAS